MSRRPVALFCGSVEWWDPAPIRQALEALDRGTLIVHGGARGADSIARCLADGLGFEVIERRADWKAEGKRAGILRNIRMVDEFLPTAVYAFRLNRSNGTTQAMQYAVKCGADLTLCDRTSGPEQLELRMEPRGYGDLRRLDGAA